jgi:hypothetical protein
MESEGSSAGVVGEQLFQFIVSPEMPCCMYRICFVSCCQFEWDWKVRIGISVDKKSWSWLCSGRISSCIEQGWMEQ